MKGIVFTYLSDMAEQHFGLDVWDAILESTGSSGVFIASETYPDEELFKLVAAAEELSGISANDLIRSFGEYMFPRFFQSNPQFFVDDVSLKDFLLTVDRVIHVEVRKLHPDAMLPKFNYDEDTENELIMYYQSPRKLCYLAEGLIAGAAAHFNTEYTLEHPQCMHDGADCCTLHIRFKDA